MRRRRQDSALRNYIGWGVTLSLLVCLWWFVLPPQLGGRTVLLTTHGTSMEPLLHDGDLAVLHKKRAYAIGDIVEYHSTALNAPVLHRIISVGTTGTYETKGDNNNFVDLDHPTKADINGKLDHRYTGLGKEVAVLKSVPARIIGATLVGLAVYAAFRGNKDESKPRRNLPRRSTPRRAGTAPISSDVSAPVADEEIKIGRQAGTPLAARVVDGVRGLIYSRSATALFALLAIVSILFAIVAFGHPVASTKDRLVIYNMHGAINYSATATGGDLVYRNGQVQTGDTIFYSMVNNVFVTFNFNVDGLGKYRGNGTIRMDAILKGTTGWSHPMVLVDTTTFTGDTGHINAVLDLNQIRSTVQQIDQLTKVGDQSYTLTLQPTVTLNGDLTGAKIQNTFSPTVDFSSTSNMLRPPAKGGSVAGPSGLNGAAAGNLTGLNTSGSGDLTIPAGAPQELRTLGVSLGVLSLRVLSVLGVLIGLAGAYGTFTANRRRSDAGKAPHEFALEAHSDLFVPVTRWDAASPGSMVIDVPTLDDLVRVAESRRTIILREINSSGHDVFVINDRHLTYRFDSSPKVQAERRFGASAPEGADK